MENKNDYEDILNNLTDGHNLLIELLEERFNKFSLKSISHYRRKQQRLILRKD